MKIELWWGIANKEMGRERKKEIKNKTFRVIYASTFFLILYI